ncbi:MAG: YbaK/EbsC family protein [bacterium]|nr:YbaK/EbsC family protein [bacterium]
MKKQFKEPKISKKVLDYLDKNKYKYEIIQHRITYTAWDTAQTEKVRPQEVAKTLVLRTDNNWIAAVLSSNRNLDKKALLKIINSERKKNSEKALKKLDFASEDWMNKNMKIGKLGAIPPFKDLLNEDVYFDKLLLKNKKLYVSSGEYDASIRVPIAQYVKIEKPILGKLSVKKP